MQESDNTTNNSPEPKQDELTVLKQRADRMGLKYHPSIGVEAIKAKINELLEADKATIEPIEPTETQAVVTPQKETPGQTKLRKRREAEQLVRINVTCMNPSKREWDGEIFTVSNAVIGTHKKYVPFNTSEGWHVPRIIYNQLVARKCQIFYTVKDRRGNSTRKGKLISEFAIEVLPMLTERELKDLAQRQAMAKGQDEA